MTTGTTPQPAADDDYFFEADLYDTLWAGLNKLDLPFFLSTVKEFGGPVLELAAGTGRVLLPAVRIAGSGVGVDLSVSMLEQGRRNAVAEGLDESAVRFVEGDLRTVRLGERFPLILAAGQPLFHCANDEDWAEALATVREHLTPGGRFVSGIPYFRFDEMAKYSERLYLAGEIRHPGTGQRIAMWDYNTYDLQEQSITRRRVSELLDEDGLVTERRHTFRKNYYRYPNEVRRTLQQAGFTIEREYGGYDESPYGPNSEHYVWVATAR
ncbi:class I SAM-dependent methyltransferase [Kitasatospora sp. NPDC085895]|uniref:class I SAM-dependent methyltransferase n=1 Tax=Kitasatospora sp. NPDC085895 TaxID=3155057 RepID=UPI00345085D5